MKIKFLKKYNEQDDTYFVDYLNLISHIDNKNILDLREIINLEIDEWIKDLIDIKLKILEKISKNSKYTSLLLINRINLWNSNEKFSIKPLIYYLAINKLKKEKINLLNAPLDLKNLIKEDFENVENERENSLVFYKNLLKNLLKILYFKKNFLNIKKINNDSTLIFTSFLNIDLYKKKSDHYFGNMFNSINQDDILWVYDDYKKSYLDKKNNYINILELVSVKNILLAFIENIIIRIKNKNILNDNSKISNGNMSSKYFYLKMINELIINDILILEIALHKSLNKIFKDKKIEIYYPYEEKPIERAILLASKNKNIICNAYAHAVYSKGHFYMQRDVRDKSPRPNRLLVSGPYSQKLFLKFGVSSDELVIVGSPRYNIQKSPYQKSKKIKLLLMVGHGFEFIIFSSWLVTNPSLSVDYEIIIRRYPYGWFKEQDHAENILKKNVINYSLGTDSLNHDVNNSDIILFESTSAAFEGGLMGKLILKINISDIIKTVHFEDNIKNPIDYCKNPDELIIKLKEYQLMTEEQINEKIIAQRLYLENYYQKFNPNIIL